MLVPISDVADWRLPDDEFMKAFRLPEAKGLGKLAQDFPFPREDRIVFDETPHEYRVDGNLVPRSVTKLLHEYASEFDSTSAVQMPHGSALVFSFRKSTLWVIGCDWGRVEQRSNK